MEREEDIGWQRMRRKFGDVLRALEGDLEPATCAALHSEDSCEIQGSCITKYVWKKVNESMAQTVDSIMLDQLVEESKQKCCDAGMTQSGTCKN